MRPRSIEAMQTLAHERGGACLSAVYVNSYTPLFWECARGHRWQAAPGNVVRGTWCPVCSREKRALTRPHILEDYQEIARQRGGQCLSERLLSGEPHLFFQCAAGHQWKARANNIAKGSWCPVCLHRQAHTIEAVRAVARERDGWCVSSAYQNNKQPLTWRCSEGHVFSRRFQSVLEGAWCPICAAAKAEQKAQAKERLRVREAFSTPFHPTIEEAQALAKLRGGLCLNDVFPKSERHLNWQCHDGHIWTTSIRSVRHGTWCPSCADRARINSLRRSFGLLDLDTREELAAFAESIGCCLVGEKVDSSGRNDFYTCSKGHLWEIQRRGVSASWCPACGSKGDALGLGRNVA